MTKVPETWRDKVDKFDEFMVVNTTEGLKPEKQDQASITEVETFDELYQYMKPSGDCMLWSGSVSRTGIPIVKYKQGIRYVINLLRRPIDHGHYNHITCDNPNCLAHVEEREGTPIKRRDRGHM